MTTYIAPIHGAYTADPIHSSFGFAVKYMGVSTFRGTLNTVTATLEDGPAGLSLTGTAAVESISIRTPDQFRAHVLSEQFFAADTYPDIRFVSDRVALDEDGSATVDGRLTIKGTTQPVTAHGTWSEPAPDPMGHERTHLALDATVNRRDFGITWDTLLPDGRSALADEVTMTVELALVARS